MMKKLTVLTLLALLIMRLIPVSAQDEAQGPWIRIANFVQGSSPLVIYLNGEPFLDDITFSSVSNYINLSATQLDNDLDIPHVERPGYIFVDGVYIPGERQDSFTLSFFPMSISNPLDVPHVDRSGYLFVDGVYIRIDEGLSPIGSILVTVEPEQYYTIFLFSQPADGRLQTLVVNETEALTDIPRINRT